MQATNLSTMTMVKVARFSEDRAEQCAMLEELKQRRDLYNLEPILELAAEEAQHYSVRRAATECAATHNSQFTLEWMKGKAENRFGSVGERAMALQGLAVATSSTSRAAWRLLRWCSPTDGASKSRGSSPRLS